MAAGAVKELVGLSAEEEQKVTAIFEAIDKDKSGALTKDECLAYWKDTHNADHMINDLDANDDKKVTKQEWLQFFKKLKGKHDADTFAGVIKYIAKGEAE